MNIHLLGKIKIKKFIIGLNKKIRDEKKKKKKYRDIPSRLSSMLKPHTVTPILYLYLY